MAGDEEPVNACIVQSGLGDTGHAHIRRLRMVRSTHTHTHFFVFVFDDG